MAAEEKLLEEKSSGWKEDLVQLRTMPELPPDSPK
jgi:hypothetical protein